jgi:tetratricopeptide (TPR) repeat protein
VYYAHPHSRLVLGNVYKEQKRYEEAIAAYQRAIEIDPNFAYSYKNLGYLQYRLGNYDASLHAFQISLDLQPGDPVILSNLGYLHLLRGDVEKAQKLIEAAMENESFGGRAWLNLGLIQVQQGQIDSAKASWQKGLVLMEDNNDWDKAVRSVFMVALGNQVEGLEQMRNLLQSNTDRDVFKNALNDAMILARSSSPLEGIEQIIQLLTDSPDRTHLRANSNLGSE